MEIRNVIDYAEENNLNPRKVMARLQDAFLYFYINRLDNHIQGLEIASGKRPSDRVIAAGNEILSAKLDSALPEKKLLEGDIVNILESEGFKQDYRAALRRLIDESSGVERCFIFLLQKEQDAHSARIDVLNRSKDTLGEHFSKYVNMYHSEYLLKDRFTFSEELASASGIRPSNSMMNEAFRHYMCQGNFGAVKTLIRKYHVEPAPTLIIELANKYVLQGEFHNIAKLHANVGFGIVKRDKVYDSLLCYLDKQMPLLSKFEQKRLIKL